MRDPLGRKRSRPIYRNLLAAGNSDLGKDQCHPSLRLAPRRSENPCAGLEVGPAETNNRCVGYGRAKAACRTCWLLYKHAWRSGAWGTLRGMRRLKRQGLT